MLRSRLIYLHLAMLTPISLVGCATTARVPIPASSQPLAATLKAVRQSQVTKPAQPEAEPSRAAEATPQGVPVALFLSFVGSHDTGDKFYFHVLVLPPSIEWTPNTVELLDRRNGGSFGPFPLTSRQESLYCSHLAWTGARFYETEALRVDELPPEFWSRIMAEDFLYRVKAEESSDPNRTIELLEPPGICASDTE